MTGQPIEATLYGPAVCEMKMILIVIHGMAELSDRYLELASRLVEEGIGVLLFDLPGHGVSARDALKLGFFAETNGDIYVLEDIHALILRLKKVYSDLPLALLGHSMGSMLARCLMAEDRHGFVHCILTGTMGKSASYMLGKRLARIIAYFYGPSHRSPLLNRLLRLNYGKLAKGNAWLTRDVTVVDRYNADPLCGFSFTASAVGDMLTWASKISEGKTLDKMSRRATYLILSGDKDPIGANGRGVTWFYKALKDRLLDAQLVLYEDARHEVLNELNRDDVISEIIMFLGRKREKREPATVLEVKEDDNH